MMKALRSGFWVFLVLSVVSLLYGLQKYTSAQQSAETKLISIGEKIQVVYWAPWIEAPMTYSNAVELVVLRKTRIISEDDKKEQEVEYPEARLLITVEPRTSHDDALQRLAQIPAERDGSVTYREIASWPGMELTFREELQRRGRTRPPPSFAQRGITAVAAGDKLLRFEITLVPNADSGLLRDAQNIARDVKIQERGNPTAVRKELEKLKAAWEGKIREKRAIKTPPTRPSKKVLSVASQGLGVPVQVHGAGLGELEVAVSKDTNNVVIASLSGLSFSTDRGTTFTNGDRGVFPLRDPSLALAVSGNFYLSVVAFANGGADHLNKEGCTVAVSQSIDKGANFHLGGFSAHCQKGGPFACFPDQAHIAADSFTATTIGNDQIYTVWRHYQPPGGVADCRGINNGSPVSWMSCSENNGVNWKPGPHISSTADFPRVAVGLDGFVYVVTISGKLIYLNRYTSCANGLIPEVGFPVLVATLNDIVKCPVPGLDRCNDGNTLSSPTVAPDPKDANHLFVAFAEKDMTVGERVVVAESRNRGGTFPRRTTVSGATSAPRFMPWACSTNGDAWVGWYDRRAATVANNDLTDYFIGSAKSASGASPSLTPGTTRNLTNRPDPQCASGWPLDPPRNSNDSDFCSSQPQKAGICSGSGARCDFNIPNDCMGGGVCQTGQGSPKYGDYNGIACMGNFVFAAWASATGPGSLPAPGVISVFASKEPVGTPALAAPTGLQTR